MYFDVNDLKGVNFGATSKLRTNEKIFQRAIVQMNSINSNSQQQAQMKIQHELKLIVSTRNPFFSLIKSK